MNGWERAEAVRLVIVTAAGGRCECRDRECGKVHGRKTGDGRCPVTDSVVAPLHTVPAVTGLDEHKAVRLAAEAMIAVCDACHGGRLAAERKQAAAAWEPP